MTTPKVRLTWTTKTLGVFHVTVYEDRADDTAATLRALGFEPDVEKV